MLLRECGVGGFKEETRNYTGFGEVLSFIQRNRLVGDEVRAEEVNRKRNPKNPFVIFEEEIAVLLLMQLKSSMSVYKFHSYIESSVVLLSGWSLILQHFSHLR